MEGIEGQCPVQVGEITDDDLEMIAGKRDQLIGRLQQRYGLQRDAAEAEVDGWIAKV